MTSVLNQNIDERMKKMDITKDEMQRIQTALKDEEFRKMFTSYAEEISNPENRKLYEDEISQMESQRGMDVKFVNPKAGYVLKTSVDGNIKAFINICTNDNIAKPTSKREPKGMNWQIPYSFSPVRDDIDKKGNNCKVFDFIVHPDTYHMSENSPRFRSLIHNTCFDGITSSFSLQVDTKNFKRINMKFKGLPTSTVIRTEKKGFQKPATAPNDKDDITDRFPYPYADGVTSANVGKPAKPNAGKTTKSNAGKQENSDQYATPTYCITHRSLFDIQSVSTAPSCTTSTRPSHLVVAVDLPLLKSIQNVDLDIMEKQLKLISNVNGGKYKLDLALPFPVNESEGSAKFDKKKRRLIVTLPVMPHNLDELPQISEEVPCVEVISSSPPPSAPVDAANAEDSPRCQDDLDEVDHDSDDTCGPVGPSFSSFPIGQPLSTSSLRLTEHSVDERGSLLVYVGRVKRVATNSVRVATDANGRLQIAFNSMGDGCFAQEYLVCIEFAFAPKASENTAECGSRLHTGLDIKVDDSSLVIAIDKHRLGVNGTLKAYRLGLTFDTMKIFEVTSKENIEESIESLSDEKDKKESPVINVARIDKEKLVIDIASNKEEEPTSPSSSSPRLHSILRQRSVTVSEPNDSLLTSTTEGDETSGENGHPKRRRTVSFSEYVDSASFRNNDTVTAMHNSLKSRRRNKRRKDQRKINREERNKQSDCSDHEISKKSEKGCNQKKRKGKKKSQQQNNTVRNNSPCYDASSSSASKEKLNEKETPASIVNAEKITEVQQRNEPVETMLSWEDNQGENKCKSQSNSFKFANTAIFELDS